MFVDGQRRTTATVFESYWSGPFHAFGAPHLRKRMNEIHVDARGLVDIYAATDFDLGVGSREAADQLLGGRHRRHVRRAGTFGGSVGSSPAAEPSARDGCTRSASAAPGR
jgi:hypothetical protein